MELWTLDTPERIYAIIFDFDFFVLINIVVKSILIIIDFSLEMPTNYIQTCVKYIYLLTDYNCVPSWYRKMVTSFDLLT